MPVLVPSDLDEIASYEDFPVFLDGYRSNVTTCPDGEGCILTTVRIQAGNIVVSVPSHLAEIASDGNLSVFLDGYRINEAICPYSEVGILTPISIQSGNVVV